MLLEGANNPGNKLHINSKGQSESHSVAISEQLDQSQRGDGYNFNTSNIILTDAAETPIFYLKNDTEEMDLIIPRVFMAFGASTAGTGEIEGIIYYNPTGGTIITAGTDKAPENFNASSSKTLGVTAKIGATAQTIIGGTKPVEFLFPSDSSRHLVSFDAIVLPRGASMLLSIKPPVGNTSMKIQAGTNIYLHGDT